MIGIYCEWKHRLWLWAVNKLLGPYCVIHNAAIVGNGTFIRPTVNLLEGVIFTGQHTVVGARFVAEYEGVAAQVYGEGMMMCCHFSREDDPKLSFQGPFVPSVPLLLG